MSGNEYDFDVVYRVGENGNSKEIVSVYYKHKNVRSTGFSLPDGTI
jgi:hypothetical protein